MGPEIAVEILRTEMPSLPPEAPELVRRGRPRLMLIVLPRQILELLEMGLDPAGVAEMIRTMRREAAAIAIDPITPSALLSS